MGTEAPTNALMRDAHNEASLRPVHASYHDMQRDDQNVWQEGKWPKLHMEFTDRMNVQKVIYKYTGTPPTRT